MHHTNPAFIFIVEAFLVGITSVISLRIAAKTPTAEGKNRAYLRMMLINGVIIAVALFYFVHTHRNVLH